MVSTITTDDVITANLLSTTAFAYILNGDGEFGANKRHGKTSQMLSTL